MNFSGAITTSGHLANGIALIGSPSGTSTVVSTGTITTSGNSAHGIYAQGGNNLVSITSNGNISAIGNASYGVNALNASGNISINATGSISGSGSSAHGIHAHSSGGNVDITVNTATTVSGGTSGGAAISTSTWSNRTATITISGTLSSASGVAIIGGNGNETVNNSGTITGNVNLGTGTNAFNNNAAGTFIAGTTVNVGTGNTLANAGSLKLGDTGSLQTTSLTGNFTQTSTGKYHVDANWANGAATRLNVTGTATLAGTVVVNTMNFTPTSGLTKQFTILSAAGGTTNNGIGLAAPSTAAVTYALTTPTANDLVLSITTNFAGAGSTANQQAAGNALNTFFAGGGSSPLTTALMSLHSGTALGSAIEQLNPVGAGQQQKHVLHGATFANAMLSCRVNGEGVALIAEGQCLWMRARQQHTEVEASADHHGFKDRVDQISAGAQFAIADNWRLGFALAYDKSETTATTSRTEGDRVVAGGVLKYTAGPALLAASLSGGWGNYDTTRSIAFTGFNATATSSADIDFAAGRLHASYLIDVGGFYVKPMIDGGLARIFRGGFSEHGGNGAGLIVASAADNVWTLSPAAELGTQLRFADVAWRPFVKAGVTLMDSDDVVTTASFITAPTATFVTKSRYDSTLFDVGAGFDLLSRGGTALRFQYDGRFGDTTEQHSFAIKGSLPF